MTMGDRLYRIIATYCAFSRWREPYCQDRILDASTEILAAYVDDLRPTTVSRESRALMEASHTAN
jgi:hypothetical protein